MPNFGDQKGTSVSTATSRGTVLRQVVGAIGMQNVLNNRLNILALRIQASKIPI